MREGRYVSNLPLEEITIAEALREAQRWLRDLTSQEARARLASMPKGTRAKKSQLPKITKAKKPRADGDRPFAEPHYWAAFILVGDPG